MSPTEVDWSIHHWPSPAAWQERMTDFAQELLSSTHLLGVTAAEVAMQQGWGETIVVRDGCLESSEQERDCHIAITLYQGCKQVSTSLSTWNRVAIQTAMQSAAASLRWMQEDACVGLADPDQMATYFPDLDLYHPWGCDQQALIERGLALESLAMSHDRLLDHCEGVQIQRNQGHLCYGNTHGLLASRSGTRHAMDCTLVAKQNGEKQRDGDYAMARDPADLMDIEGIALSAASRAVRRLGARSIPTQSCSVLLAPPVARELIGYFISAISGSALYRQQSFLIDALGQPLFPSWLHWYEDPWLPQGWGSTSFDADGVQTAQRYVVKDGHLESYLLGSYAARRLGLPSTGHAGGLHHLSVEADALYDQAALMKQMKRGLYVTEMMGSGVDLTTGQFSQGVFGFWVEDGEMAFPVEGVTMAGDLKSIYSRIQAMGSDLDRRSRIVTGSMLLDRITIAGTS